MQNVCEKNENQGIVLFSTFSGLREGVGLECANTNPGETLGHS